MSNAQHTPGPWSIYFNSQDDLVIRKMFPDGQESHSIARCHSGAANARLIAAAPELLEALQRLSAQCTRLRLPGQPETDAEKTARAVIAKATGGAA